MPVTQADNLRTVELTTWLILYDFFFEDGPASHQRLIEEFGSIADEHFAGHREAAEQVTAERIEALEAGCTQLREATAQVIAMRGELERQAYVDFTPFDHLETALKALEGLQCSAK